MVSRFPFTLLIALASSTCAAPCSAETSVKVIKADLSSMIATDLAQLRTESAELRGAAKTLASTLGEAQGRMDRLEIFCAQVVLSRLLL